MTPHQREAWFKKHPVTEETAPKYEAIRLAEQAMQDLIDWVLYCGCNADAADERDDKINETAAKMADTIVEHVPRCPDQTAAIRYLVEAKMFLIRAHRAKVGNGGIAPAITLNEAQVLLWKSSMTANKAIACGGI